MTRVSLPRIDGHVASYDKHDNYEGMIVRGDVYLAERYDASKQLYVPEPAIIEGHRLEQFRDRNHKLRIAGPDLKNCSCDTLDISWLRSCSDAYDISPKISDYVITEVGCVVADIPNRNMDAFEEETLVEWRIPMSRMAYQTFIGKPTHQDHNNQNPRDAKGVILDAVLVPFMGRPHVKLLKAFDRSKDPSLAKKVQQRNRIGHSMGALVEKTTCSLPWCEYVSDGRTTCDHIANGEGKGQIINGHLVYECMGSYYYIESSSVEDPAYIVALSDVIHT